MTAVARDEAVHLAQVMRLLLRRGGVSTGFTRTPTRTSFGNWCARASRLRLWTGCCFGSNRSSSCERFAVLAAAASDEELASFYQALYSSEFGHYRVFLKLAGKIADKAAVEARWRQMLASEAEILARQPAVHVSTPGYCTVKLAPPEWSLH